jgi:PAS domain S-box-containing protein
VTGLEVGAWVGPMLEAVDLAGVGLLVTRDDADGSHHLHQNDSALRILGRTREELRTLPVLAVVSPAERARLQAWCAELFAGTRPPGMVETVVERPDGTLVPVELGIAHHRDGGALYSLVMMRDVSSVRQLQARLLAAEQLATVGTLCAGISHAINNPLTSVLLQAGSLRRSVERWAPDPAHRQRAEQGLDQVTAGVERVAGAVRGLSMLAAPPDGERGPVDVRAVVDNAVRRGAQMFEHRARIAAELVDVPPIEGNAPKLAQAVLNLVVEAAQAFEREAPAGNAVLVTLRAEPPWVVIEVADNGPALDPASAASAFVPFVRVRGPRSTGIALAVAQSLVSAMGGTASLQPRDGGGAIATLRLPQRP